MIQTSLSPSNAAINNDETILMDIHDADKNIAVYERDISALESEINQLMEDSFEYRSDGTAEEICSSLESDFDSIFQGPSALLTDIKKLVKQFYQVTNSSSFSLLLATVNTNMCRRFHTDINDLRMLCTYSGPGTLWLTEDNTDRKALYSLEENSAIAKDEKLIQQVETGSVAILKGAIYPKEGTHAIVHRSPTIEESGERRLLLRIDTNDFLGLLED